MSQAVVQLCLKLTESELKSLLARMAEWRDVEINTKTSSNEIDSELSSESNGNSSVSVWQKRSRGVCFYNLISTLALRLRSIFLPSMVSHVYLILHCYVRQCTSIYRTRIIVSRLFVHFINSIFQFFFSIFFSVFFPGFDME